ncbi:MAG: hypothetical protein C4523_12635 [Myxococcales bacterium]|nr:MAG: hypothetical protein C4523_12635 [Myxococcales bacterium]
MPFWLIVVIFIAATVGASLLAARRPRGRDVKPSALGDFDFPTAEEGRPIPVVFGTVKISAPNVIWYGDLKSDAIRKDGQTIGFKYSVGIQMALCHGPVDDVIALLAGEDDKQVFFTKTVVNGGGGQEDYRKLDVNQPNLFGGERDGKEGGIVGRFDFYRGIATQTASSYLTPFQGSLTPPYHGLCHVVARRPYLGTSQYIKKLSWVVRYQPSNLGLTTQQTQIQHDANPAEILYVLKTNPIFGLGENPATINTSSFAAAGATLATERMGMSLLIESKNSAQKFIDDILQHIDGVLYTDTQTGLCNLALARDDYDEASLLELTDADLVEPAELSRGSWSEMLNEIKVEYSRSNGINRFERGIEQAHEAALHAVQGERITETIELHGFTRADLAQAAATRELRAASFPLLKGTLKVNRRAWPLRIGQVFRLTSKYVGEEWREPRGSATSLRAGSIQETGSGSAWTNLTNAQRLDDLDAETLIHFPDNTQSKRLELTDLRLRGIPLGVQIDAIEVQLRYKIPQGNPRWKAQLLLNGAPIGNELTLGVAQDSNYATVIFGGPNATLPALSDWGVTPSAAQLRDATFGVAITAEDALSTQDTEFDLDAAAPVTVYWSRPAQIQTLAPASASSVNLFGSGVAWSDPANALASDDARATAVLGPGSGLSQSRTENLRLRFAASPPVDSQIARIALALERSVIQGATPPNRTVNEDNTIRLYANGAPLGPDKKEVAAWPATDAVKTYEWKGADLAGITPEVLAASDFSADVGAFSSDTSTGETCTARVDHAALTVEWRVKAAASVIMRVGPIRYGRLEDGTIEIDCVEDIFAHVEEPVFDNPAAGDSGWLDPIDPPIDPLDPVDDDGLLLLEAPFHLANSIEILVAAQRRDGSSSSYEVWSDEGDGFYPSNEVPSFCPTGRLAANYDKETDALDATGFTVQSGRDLDKLVSTDAAGRIRGDNLAVLRDANGEEEWMSWQTLTDNGDGTFTFSNVVRGVFDTRPLDHLSGAMVYFVSSGPRGSTGLAHAGVSRVAPFTETQTVDIKALPRNPKGVLAIGGTTEKTVVLVERANKPYPPGNVQINGERFPASITGDAVVTWAHRNRFELRRQNRVAQQDEGNIGSPEGTYTFEVYLDGVIVPARTQTGLTGTTATYTAAQRAADDPGGTAMVSFKIYDNRAVAPPPLYDPPPADDSPPGGGYEFIQS